MKTLLLAAFLVLLSFFKAQVYSGAGGSIVNNGGQETFFNANVSGLPSQIDSTFGLVEVSIDINHPDISELHILLRSPWGTEVDLTGVMMHKPGSPNYSGTVFNSSHPTSITLGNAPFTGTFRPLGYLGRFNSGKNPNGAWRLVVKDFVPANEGTVTGWSLKFAANPPKPVVFTSSNLPIVVLNTNNQPLSDKEIMATISTIDNGANRNYLNSPAKYSGKCTAHLRGSSSKMFEKKNIKIELRDNSGVADLEVPLLNMPPESDWVLTAFYNDKSLMRNPLSHHLFSKMGRYAPRFRYVELVLNDEYFGIYLLMEQPKRGIDRVNVNKLESHHNTYPHITGGYIVQINRSDDPGWESLYPGISDPSIPTKFYYQYNYPRAAVITEPQKAYIKAVLDSFETVMAGPDFADPKKGYKKFINDESFVDFMIINELSKNVDAYKLSTYLYKHHVIDGGKINIGPTWDYDLAWHNSDFGNAFSELYWQFNQPNTDYAIPTWWNTLMKDPAFKDKLYCRYHTLRKDILSNNKIYEFIDANTALLAEAQARNFIQFPVIGAKLYGNPQTPQDQMSYAKEIEDLKNWVYRRGEWLDANIPGFCQDVGVAEASGQGKLLKAYPNPFQDKLRIDFSLNGESPVVIHVYDITGSRIHVIHITGSAGENVVNVDSTSWPSGVYVLELQAGSRRLYHKVVKNTR